MNGKKIPNPLKILPNDAPVVSGQYSRPLVQFHEATILNCPFRVALHLLIPQTEKINDLEIMAMTAKFDIFHKLPGGQSIWVKAIEGLEEANRELQEMVKKCAGEYFIFDSRNGRIISSKRPKSTTQTMFGLPSIQ